MFDSFLLKGGYVGVIGDRADVERASMLLTKHAEQIQTDVYSAKEEPKQLEGKMSAKSRRAPSSNLGFFHNLGRASISTMLIASFLLFLTPTLTGCGKNEKTN